MKILLTYSNYFSIMVFGQYVMVNYPMNISLKEFLNKNCNYLSKCINEEMDRCNSIEEKEMLKKCYDLIINNNEDVVNCFERIEMTYPDNAIFDKLDTSFNGVNIPVVFDSEEKDDEYLLENISVLDKKMIDIGVPEIGYVIKQCVESFDAHGVEKYYSASDVLLVLNYIKEMTSNIENNNFSTLEKVMYIYDLVKDRYYKEELETEDYLESRDMARILKGDRIVCLGFSYLFKALLDKVNIPNRIAYLDGINSNIGHARVMVRIVDDKYNLNHILYFDPTWDSKKISDNSLDKYNYFARIKRFFNVKDKNKRLIDNEYLPFDIRENRYYLYNNNSSECMRQAYILFNMINWQKYFEDKKIDPCYYSDLFGLLEIDLVDYFVPSFDKFDLFIYQECSKMLNRNLPGDVFFRCLYTVRKVQNNLYPDKFDFDEDKFMDIYNKYLLIPSDNNKELYIKK